MAALLGLVTSVTGNYNYLVNGTALPVGAPVNRNFANTEGELYAQDSWKVKRNFHRQPGDPLRTDAAGARSQRPADLYRPTDWRLVR